MKDKPVETIDPNKKIASYEIENGVIVNVKYLEQ
jgi:hypothetical protein